MLRADARRLGALGLLVVLLAACGSRRDAPSAASVPQTGPQEAAYLAPPGATSVQLRRDGVLTVAGLAPPGSSVEIMSPEGEQARTTANRQGGWTAHLSAAPQPRLYAISARLAGRTLHAEGALIVAPGGTAVTVRAGYAASPVGADPRSGIASVDYDPSGFIAVAGSAPPRGELTLVVDGTPAAVGQADAGGRYALLAANRRLTMGPHTLQVRAPGGAPEGAAKRQVTLEPPVALAAPYQAWPAPDGWRVEWALNGGGVQTTLILAR